MHYTGGRICELFYPISPGCYHFILTYCNACILFRTFSGYTNWNAVHTMTKVEICSPNASWSLYQLLRPLHTVRCKQNVCEQVSYLAFSSSSYIALSVILVGRMLLLRGGDELRRSDGISMPPWLRRANLLFGTGQTGGSGDWSGM